MAFVEVSGCLYSDTYYVGIDSLHILAEQFSALIYGIEQEINRSHLGSLDATIAYKYRGSHLNDIEHRQQDWFNRETGNEASQK